MRPGRSNDLRQEIRNLDQRILEIEESIRRVDQHNQEMVGQARSTQDRLAGLRDKVRMTQEEGPRRLEELRAEKRSVGDSKRRELEYIKREVDRQKQLMIDHLADFRDEEREWSETEIAYEHVLDAKREEHDIIRAEHETLAAEHRILLCYVAQCLGVSGSALEGIKPDFTVRDVDWEEVEELRKRDLAASRGGAKHGKKAG